MTQPVFVMRRRGSEVARQPASLVLINDLGSIMTQVEAAPLVRTLVFTTLGPSNVFLALVNRSFTLPAFRTLGTLMTTLFFGPIAGAPLKDLVSWLTEHTQN